jgi:hypothetical protein
MAEQDSVSGILFRYTGSDEDREKLQRLSDAGTQVMVMLLGSGPALASLDGLLAAQAASGLMYYNAVSNQQKTNVLGMATTAKAVRYMLDPHDGEFEEFDDVDE